MLQIFISIWSWLSDPKNKSLRILMGVAILIAIILIQCSNNRGLKSELSQQSAETQRVINNFEALSSPLIQYKINDSTLIAEKLAVKITMDELKKNYSDLMIGFEKFKKSNPKVIEKITIINNETIREVPIYVKTDSLGNKKLIFSSDKVFADSNYRKLSGTIPVSTKIFTKNDSTEIDAKILGYYTQVYPGLSNFTLEQGIKLKVGLFENPKTKKVTIAATTSYPGITFTKLDGADIMSDEVSKKATKNFRKTWGIGFNIGYGAVVNLNNFEVFFGPQAGIGIIYTPKLLQWGK